MKSRRSFFVFLLLFAPLILLGQGESTLPSELPETFFGSWVDDKDDVVLIVSTDYIIIQNELWYYNEIRKNNEIVNFSCVHNSNTKNISVLGVETASIYLDEGYKRTKLTKALIKSPIELPEGLIGNWHDLNDKIEIFKNKVVFSKNTYEVDYNISINGVNYYFVLYNAGEYYFCFNTIANGGHLLNTNFSREILFKKESFIRKHFLAFISIVVLLLLLTFFFLFKWRITLAKKKEVFKRKFIEIQLKSIRSQMNPHFLFNALSAIQNLINKGDNERANHYLTEFSQLMRLTLDKSEKGLVPLSDEIKSITKYLELEKLRFHFNYNIKIEEEVNIHQVEIPAMLIQPFVENAIIHGIKEIRDDKKISIQFKVDKENLVCFIIDNGIGIEKSKAKKVSGFKTERYGLKLAQDRINLINESYNTNARVEIIDISSSNKETGTQVVIQIPLRY